jgi:hypothetical protein
MRNIPFARPQGGFRILDQLQGCVVRVVWAHRGARRSDRRRLAALGGGNVGDFQSIGDALPPARASQKSDDGESVCNSGSH